MADKLFHLLPYGMTKIGFPSFQNEQNEKNEQKNNEIRT